MATPERIREVFHRRLADDSADQLEKAGEVWPDLPLNFFYITNAADVVDIVITNIAEQIAAEDGVSIPNVVLQNLQTLVNPKTLVKEGMRLVFLTVFQPQ